MPPSPSDRRAVDPRPKPALLWLARLTALVAVGLAGYLLWASLLAAGHVAGCGDESSVDCSSVLRSRWSSWLGLPVGLPAIGIYMVVFGLLFCIDSRRSSRIQRVAWRILLPLAAVLAGAVVWFVGLQLFALKSVCPYCMALHACGLTLAAFLFWNAPIGRWPAPGMATEPFSLTFRVALLQIAIGLAGIAVLIGGQIAVEPPARTFQVTATPPVTSPESSTHHGPASSCAGVATTSVEPKNPPHSVPDTAPSTTSPNDDDPWFRPGPHRRVVLSGGKATIDSHEVPIFGDPDAPIVIAEMFDYTCPECRSLHSRMREARQRYGKRLAVAMLPIPINSNCNKYAETKPPHELACEYARLALAVWNTRPEAFAEYHDWLMEPELPPPLADAHQQAAKLLGGPALEATLTDKRIDRQLADDARIYLAVDRGALPKLLVRAFVLVGSPSTTEKLCAALENYCDLHR